MLKVHAPNEGSNDSSNQEQVSGTKFSQPGSGVGFILGYRHRFGPAGFGHGHGQKEWRKEPQLEVQEDVHKPGMSSSRWAAGWSVMTHGCASGSSSRTAPPRVSPGLTPAVRSLQRDWLYQGSYVSYDPRLLQTVLNGVAKARLTRTVDDIVYGMGRTPGCGVRGVRTSY